MLLHALAGNCTEGADLNGTEQKESAENQIVLAVAAQHTSNSLLSECCLLITTRWPIMPELAKEKLHGQAGASRA